MSDNVVHEWISESGHTHKLFSDGTIKEYMQPDYCIDTRRTHTTIAFARLAERVAVLEEVAEAAEAFFKMPFNPLNTNYINPLEGAALSDALKKAGKMK